MLKQLFGAFFAAMLLSMAGSVSAGDHDAILGNWSTAEGKSTVELYECNGKVCGRIIALKEPTYPADDDKGMAGQTKVDRENPDPKMQKQPLVGRVILQDFDRVERDQWKNGTIYDPENGKTYKCNITLANPKQLKVRGYIGFSLLGRTTEWTR